MEPQFSPSAWLYYERLFGGQTDDTDTAGADIGASGRRAWIYEDRRRTRHFGQYREILLPEAAAKDVRCFLPAMRQPNPTATAGAEKEILFGQMPVHVVEPASGATPASNDAASDLCMVRQSVRAVRKAQTTILQPCLLRGCQKEGGTRCLILNSVRWLTRQRWRSPGVCSQRA